MKKGHAYLLSILSDGQFHSGEVLATHLNISRAAIWKSIRLLESLGLNIEAVRGKGYCLNQPIELFSEEKIKKCLSPRIKKSCHKIDVLFKTDSTNSNLFDQLKNETIHGNVVLAEYQSQGRGRRGNKWIAPLGSGITLSVGWRFDIVPKTFSQLSLYMGVAIARALHSENIDNIGLKWPNDIVVKNKKIGGILIEIRGETSGPVDVVIGIGLNYELNEEIKTQIAQPVTDICSHTNQRISRNAMVATLLSKVFEVLDSMQNDQSLNLLDEWRVLDCHSERHAKLLLPNEVIEGVLKGVDDQGALLISVDGKIKSYTSGEISLRVAS
ncbi:MAG: bifunctional biotin--[acetyl-CoA-carboxylase] ligase/biotin operon repressor BirA [Proteobacteria bacterium]|nr:bifunctional biotin--[acetyl-CoA-carboxylase] ligase/biotin operon repressor BirA [Pseudomonadota bacterium]NOG61712.1 bifunctional biotin--[acetyl-CoA-carboxylase] ligase/biotin operon repressor BirA [Pseudomonadota bacterium]